jgi:hypothetical protein
VATVTFDANTAGGFGFVGNNAVDANVGSAVTAAIVSITPTGISYFKDFSSGNVSSFGSFNETMDLKNASTSQSQIVYTLALASGTFASAASVLTADNKGFDAAAHVRCDTCSIPGELGMTFFVGETAAVPEPTYFLVLGLGLGGLIVKRRWAQR